MYKSSLFLAQRHTNTHLSIAWKWTQILRPIKSFALRHWWKKKTVIKEEYVTRSNNKIASFWVLRCSSIKKYSTCSYFVENSVWEKLILLACTYAASWNSWVTQPSSQIIFMEGVITSNVEYKIIFIFWSSFVTRHFKAFRATDCEWSGMCCLWHNVLMNAMNSRRSRVKTTFDLRTGKNPQKVMLWCWVFSYSVFLHPTINPHCDWTNEVINASQAGSAWRVLTTWMMH